MSTAGSVIGDDGGVLRAEGEIGDPQTDLAEEVGDGATEAKRELLELSDESDFGCVRMFRTLP